ncbi:MAG: tripartite tricarboxylate transporter substrate binding protein [Betaproteobacteria bacterium]|nr:tripartite tricarboxylate transporter substrate binding protein [Betaproteobacteria bacterium]
MLHHPTQRIAALVCIAGAMLAALPSGALGQDFPNKPIRFIVPFPPGGGADFNARAVAQKMAESLGQPVLVESRAGAGGNIGTEFVARAPADGYTMLFATNGITVQPHLAPVRWDPVKDFAAVSLITTYPLIIAVHPSVPAQTLQELVAFAKANPSKLTYGSSGVGAPLHMAAEYFKSVVGVDIVHVPYKGNAPMTAALLSGEINMVFDSMTGPLPNIRAGKLRGLAVTSKRRVGVVPDLPTVAESVAPSYAYEAWNGVLVPAGTPRDNVARLATEIGKAVAQTDVSQRLTAAGYFPISTTPEQFTAIITEDLLKFGRLIREAGIKAD